MAQTLDLNYDHPHPQDIGLCLWIGTVCGEGRKPSVCSNPAGAVFEEAAWTDDTDQSLLILMSFLHSGGKQNIDYLDFAKRLKVSQLLVNVYDLTISFYPMQHWVQFGFRALDRLPLGLGKTVGSVVQDSAFLEDPLVVSTR
jgi:hypothetical protein